MTWAFVSIQFMCWEITRIHELLRGIQSGIAARGKQKNKKNCYKKHKPKMMYERKVDRSFDQYLHLRYVPDDRRIGVHFRPWAGDFSLPYVIQTGCRIHPASYPKRLWALPQDTAAEEWSRSPLSCSQVKNTCSYISIPPYAFMVWYWIKHKDNATCSAYL
jgi:hypothetical protein